LHGLFSEGLVKLFPTHNKPRLPRRRWTKHAMIELRAPNKTIIADDPHSIREIKSRARC